MKIIIGIIYETDELICMLKKQQEYQTNERSFSSCTTGHYKLFQALLKAGEMMEHEDSKQRNLRVSRGSCIFRLFSEAATAYSINLLYKAQLHIYIVNLLSALITFCGSSELTEVYSRNVFNTYVSRSKTTILQLSKSF